MNYLKTNLQLGEDIIYVSKLHYALFFQPALFFLLGWWLYAADIKVLHYGGVLLLFMGVVSLVQRIMVKIGSVYAVTNKRVILKTGIISRRAVDLVLAKCEGLHINQSVLGRILGFGTITITTGGATSSYPYIANPMQFKREINTQIG
ncbi:PH domain-containing protein [Parabacteroides sp. OttesenSCG-928-G06]|nr:PH domain-containing protein [Parabacteroides sp. OttesenSCG-928-G06]